MTLQATIRSLSEVAARLPFHIDDYARINEAFARWRDTGHDDELETVELWIYCYTRRYFLAKFLNDRPAQPVELDAVVDQAFGRVHRNLETIEQPDRFANWVSVICKNTYLNFRRARREHLALDERGEPAEEPAEEASAGAGLDRYTTRLIVGQAILRLPPSLQEVARMRFLEGRSYEAISEATGRPIPSLRSYVNKSLMRLREDPEVRALARELL